MINYQPFWETLKASGESTYSLIHDYSISSATIDRLRKNRPLSTSTINDLCIILAAARKTSLLYASFP
ncbi:XRE family transcriptional regulator [Clostridium sp. OM04-12AA]|nr:helix-turn-helix transcriptional regulator [Clostridium sp. OM04-12AA]RHV54359.1 XRE family transcriptional regulator [Clostridium sp. OM04-12AA]